MRGVRGKDIGHESVIAGSRDAGAPRATIAEVITGARMGIKLQTCMCSRAHHEAGEHAGPEGSADAQQQLQPVLAALLGDVLPPLRRILQGTTTAGQSAVPACLLMLSAGLGSTAASWMPQLSTRSTTCLLLPPALAL